VFEREIYWNVGTGEIVLMYLFAGAAVSVMAYGLSLRVNVYRQGRPLDRTDKPLARLAVFFREAILQKTTLNEKIPGLAHALFFWSFLALFAGTTLVFIQADITDPLFGVRFLKGGFYLLFSFSLDIAGLVAMLGLGVLLVRRYVRRPAGLESTWSHALMHALLFAILSTGFLVEGLRMAATELRSNMELAYFSPVGLMVAQLFSGAGDEAIAKMHTFAWWLHLSVSLAFIASIPFTGFRHIFTAPANHFFADRRPKGSLATLDLEDEQAEGFGAASVSELSWKDLLDADACVSCARCQNRCPAYRTDKPLSPMKIVQQIEEAAFGEPGANLVELITGGALWSCTTCLACQQACPAGVEHAGKIIEIRRHMALMQGSFPGEEVVTALENIEVNGNPFGMAPAARGDWAKGLNNVTALAGNPGVDIVYFAGCAASFDARNRKVAVSFMNLARAAGLTVGILGKEEKCCGEPARKLGNEYLYQTTATENIERLKSYGTKKVVVTCPHCLTALARDYRDLGLEIEVEHHTVFLRRLLDEGRLSVTPEAFACVYHDSCLLGRSHGVYEQPRSILRAAGGDVREMEESRAESFCCGGGGGRFFAEEKLGSRINATRARMAAGTGAGVLAVNCPFCLSMLEDGVKTGGLEGRLAPKDIAEILEKNLYYKQDKNSGATP